MCRVSGVLAVAGVVGCVNLAPEHVRAAAPVAAVWPGVPASAPSTMPASAPVDLEWRAFVVDPRLRDTIDRALQNNRDLRVAALNIERARAQYRIQRGASVPEVNVGAAVVRQRSPTITPASGTTSTSTGYGVDLGLAAYELDLFGRVRNLGESALQNFFAVEENRRSTLISLVAEVATVWLTLAADTDRLQLARHAVKPAGFV